MVDLRLLRQIGIARIRQVASLGPVAHRFKIDVEHDAHFVAAIAISHHLFDVREKLQLVFHILGRKHGAVVGATLQTAHVFDTVDDFQMPMAVDEARVIGVVPAICGQHLCRGFGVFVIAFEQAGRLHQHLALLRHFDFHTRTWHTHGVGSRFVVGL